MKIAVCGIACEKCPRMLSQKCPNGEVGCTPRETKCAKSVHVPLKKACGYVSSAPSFPVKLPGLGRSASGTANIFPVKHTNQPTNGEDVICP